MITGIVISIKSGITIHTRLCEEYGLSVIPQNENKGKNYIEYTAAKQGTSYKAQLKTDIDKAVRKSLDYSDFLLRMEIAGYEVKHGKYISFRAAGRERFIRGKTLGGYYTEDSIKERIAKNAIHRPKKDSRRINLIIDIQNCIKAQESKGYEHWSKIYNLKQAAKTLNFLTENNLTTYEDLEAAERKLKGKNPPPLETLIKDNGDLSERKAKLYEEYKKLKTKSAEIEVIRSNVDTLLNRPKERNTEIEK